VSFPASLTTRTIKGRFVTYPDGAPSEGEVRVILDRLMQGPTDDVFVTPFDRKFKFNKDNGGQVSFVLPSNNDPQWTPASYKVILTVDGVEHLRQKMTVPYNGSGDLDLTDLLNIPAAPPGQTYVLLASKGAPNGVASLDEDGRLLLSQVPAELGGAVTWDDIEDKPAVFPHDEVTISDVTGLTATLSAKADLVGGVLPTAQVPAIAVVDFLGNAANQTAMLAMVGQKGDWCIRTDLGQAWQITDNNPADIDSWTAIPLGTVAVQSVNGQTGVVVLGKADVGLDNVTNTSDADKPVSIAQQEALDDKADVTHSHSTSDVTGLDTALASKATVTALTDGLAGKADASHDHSASDITSGTLPAARGGTGLTGFTASNYLRGASSTTLEFRSPAQVLSDIGAAATDHDHPIADVTNLQTALDGKSNTGHAHAWGDITDKPTTFPSNGSITGDLTVSGYTGLEGATVGGDLVVEGYTSLQGASIAGDLEVPNFHVTGVSYLDGVVTHKSRLMHDLDTDPAVDGINRWDLGYTVTTASSDLERVYIGANLICWRNENGFLRGTPRSNYKDDALVRGVPRGDLTSENGGFVELENAARTQVLYKRDWRTGSLWRGDGTAAAVKMADVLVLSAAADVPDGTPAGTVILRTEA
jgi:hypothetical protein